MAARVAGQPSRPAFAFALALPLLHGQPAAVPVSWECGPGYHKPLFGRCVPDAGVPLLRTGRYTASLTRHTRRVPGPIRSMAPWGPRYRG